MSVWHKMTSSTIDDETDAANSAASMFLTMKSTLHAWKRRYYSWTVFNWPHSLFSCTHQPVTGANINCWWMYTRGKKKGNGQKRLEKTSLEIDFWLRPRRQHDCLILTLNFWTVDGVPRTSMMTTRRCAGPIPLLASHSYQSSYSSVTLWIISSPPCSASKCWSWSRPTSTSCLNQRTVGDGSPDASHMIDALAPSNSVTFGGRMSMIRAGTVHQIHVVSEYNNLNLNLNLAEKPGDVLCYWESSFRIRRQKIVTSQMHKLFL